MRRSHPAAAIAALALVGSGAAQAAPPLRSDEALGRPCNRPENLVIVPGVRITPEILKLEIYDEPGGAQRGFSAEFLIEEQRVPEAPQFGLHANLCLFVNGVRVAYQELDLTRRRGPGGVTRVAGKWPLDPFILPRGGEATLFVDTYGRSGALVVGPPDTFTEDAGAPPRQIASRFLHGPGPKAARATVEFGDEADPPGDDSRAGGTAGGADYKLRRVRSDYSDGVLSLTARVWNKGGAPGEERDLTWEITAPAELAADLEVLDDRVGPIAPGEKQGATAVLDLLDQDPLPAAVTGRVCVAGPDANPRNDCRDFEVPLSGGIRRRNSPRPGPDDPGPDPGPSESRGIILSLDSAADPAADAAGRRLVEFAIEPRLCPKGRPCETSRVSYWVDSLGDPVDGAWYYVRIVRFPDGEGDLDHIGKTSAGSAEVASAHLGGRAKSWKVSETFALPDFVDCGEPVVLQTEFTAYTLVDGEIAEQVTEKAYGLTTYECDGDPNDEPNGDPADDPNDDPSGDSDPDPNDDPDPDPDPPGGDDPIEE